MTSTVTVSLRIPTADVRLLKKRAAARGMKLATYVRHAAVQYATYVASGDVDFTGYAMRVGLYSADEVAAK